MALKLKVTLLHTLVVSWCEKGTMVIGDLKQDPVFDVIAPAGYLITA